MYVCPSVRWLVILLDFQPACVPGRPTWKVEERGPQLFLCIFRKCIFQKCIFRKCIFRKCIFWKYIFWKSIFGKCIFRKTFLTQSLPSPNFFKPSVPGEVRVFRAFASLLLYMRASLNKDMWQNILLTYSIFRYWRYFQTLLTFNLIWSVAWVDWKIKNCNVHIFCAFGCMSPFVLFHWKVSIR